MKTLPSRLWACLLCSLALLILPTTPALAFVDPPTFSPAQPQAGQQIDMSVTAGECHTFGTPPPGYPFVEVQTTGDIVDVIIAGVEATDPILCIFRTGTLTVDIGSLPQGDYTVRVRIRNANPPFDVLPPASQSNLRIVGRAVPVTVPSTQTTGLAILAALLITLTAIAFRRPSTLLALIIAPTFLTLPGVSSAQDNSQHLFVEISREEGAPTPEYIVDDFDLGSGLPPPVRALSVENPDLFEYLIPREYRAYGEFKTYLDSNPELPRARLEQTILVRYPEGANLDVALAALLADPYVRHASIPGALELDIPAAAASSTASQGPAALPASEKSATQYWINGMSFSSAWAKAGGWSRVGVLDNGLYTLHPDLRSQNSNGSLSGGNFLPSLSVDLGRHGSNNPIDYNVDEMEPVAITHPSQNACDPQGTGSFVASFAGHGTHVHGLIAANHSNTDGTVGACKHCGLLSIRALYEYCSANTRMAYPVTNEAAVWAGLVILADNGAQIVNMSFGGPFAQNHCSIPSNFHKTECLALAHASSRGVLMVASSGNARTRINFPASDPRVVSVGGLDEAMTFWDEDKDPPPHNQNGCPYYPSRPNMECGSNYTVDIVNDAKQELVAPARRVLSTLYPGKAWNPDILCDDAALGVSGDGKGPCTGTSMSAPIVSGLAGILRSVNPLILPGEAILGGPQRGIRSVLIESSVLPTFPAIWDPKLGHGVIKADNAVSILLGYSDNTPVKNRLTPLFSLRGTAAKDWAYTTAPQMALGLMTNQVANYQPQGTLTPGYPAFPYIAPAPPPPAPRADAYVLTTEYKTRPNHPNLLPLYSMMRTRTWPLNCTPGIAGCNGHNRDSLLLTSAAQVQTATLAGYEYRGREGYVYQACSPEPACIPQGAERLWLKCKTSDDDCAVFLERQRASFEAQGYVSAYPAGSNMLLGYAYPNVDSDGDGLINGFEYLLGSNPDLADSDLDGVADGIEYPQAGIPISDPCSAGRCRTGYLFEDGFERFF